MPSTIKAVVYDPVYARELALIAKNDTTDLWAYSNGIWQILRTDFAPQNLYRWLLVFHRGLGALIAISPGGIGKDVTVWDGATAINVFPSPGGPTSKYTALNYAAAYDEARDRIVISGIRSQGLPELRAETWELDVRHEGSTWTVSWTPAVIGAGAVSPSLGMGGLYFDTVRRRVCAADGARLDIPVLDRSPNEIYEWDGANWTSISRCQLELPQPDSHGSFDRTRQRLVVLGGNAVDDILEYDGSVWQVTRTSPGPRSNDFVVWDSVRGQAVLFGGGYAYKTQCQPDYSYPASNVVTNLDDTWVFQASGWHQASTSGPSGRYESRFAFDESRGIGVLYGGAHYGPRFHVDATLHDTWVWDGQVWSERNVPGPESLSVDGYYYDPTLGGIVLVGRIPGFPGAPNTAYRSWLFDGEQWQLLAEDVNRPRSQPLFDQYSQTFIARVSNSNRSKFVRWSGTAWVPSSIKDPSANLERLIRSPSAAGGWPAFLRGDGNVWLLRNGSWVLAEIPGKQPFGPSFYDPQRDRVFVLRNVLHWRFDAAVWNGRTGIELRSQPQSQTVYFGDPIVLSVQAADGGGAVQSIRWQFNDHDFVEAPPYSGVHTDTLTIQHADAGQRGSYRVIVTSNCGELISESATIQLLTPSCGGDVDRNGLVNSWDLTAFLDHFGKTTGFPREADADLNGRIDTRDLIHLLTHLGQHCP